MIIKVINNLNNWFVPEKKMIQEQITKLIDREYMEQIIKNDVIHYKYIL